MKILKETHYTIQRLEDVLQAVNSDMSRRIQFALESSSMKPAEINRLTIYVEEQKLAQ